MLLTSDSTPFCYVSCFIVTFSDHVKMKEKALNFLPQFPKVFFGYPTFQQNKRVVILITIFSCSVPNFFSRVKQANIQKKVQFLFTNTLFNVLPKQQACFLFSSAPFFCTFLPKILL